MGFFTDEEDEEWYRDHPELNRNGRWYVIAPALGVLSLSFSLGLRWNGFAGAVVATMLLGGPGALVAVWMWGRAADRHRDDPARLRWWLWSGIAIAAAAVYVYVKSVAPGGS